MRARLEGHDERGTARALPGRAQREDFGVGAAVFGVPSFGHDLVPLQHDRADEGIRRDAPPTPQREAQGASHHVRS